MNQQRLRSTAWAATCFLMGLAAGCRLGREPSRDPDTVPASRQIVQDANDAIVSADGSYTIVMANPAAAALFGTTVDAMIGSPLARFIESAKSDPDELLDYFRPGSGRAGRRSTDYAVTGLRADG
jgi:PAS domain-containing protein